MWIGPQSATTDVLTWWDEHACYFAMYIVTGGKSSHAAYGKGGALLFLRRFGGLWVRWVGWLKLVSEDTKCLSSPFFVITHFGVF